MYTAISLALVIVNYDIFRNKIEYLLTVTFMLPKVKYTTIFLKLGRFILLPPELIQLSGQNHKEL